LPPGKYTVSEVTLALNPAYGSANITTSIWGVGPDDNPSNELQVVGSQLVSSPGNVNFIPTGTITLPGGNYYLVAAPTTSADNAKVGWYWTESISWTGFGILGNYAGMSTGAWQNFVIGYGPYQMSVQATPSQ